MDSTTNEQEKTPKRRGRKPITDPMHLTPSEIMILTYIWSNQDAQDGASVTKRELADVVGRNVKTVDIAMARLRQRGIVESQARYGETGGQYSNVYRVTKWGRMNYPDLFKTSA